MANSAAINPTAEQQASRNISRIRTLRACIEKNLARGKTEKVAQLQSELNRRMAAVAALKAELDSL